MPPAEKPKPGSQSMLHDAVSDFLMQQASGTSTNPAAAPMHMEMTDYDQWMLMAHGQAFVNQVWQGGPRGGDKLFSTNWVMGMAERKLGPGHLMLRTMLSLEPATIGKAGYPELFQTGETAYGRPIRDAQHPHDLFMELAAEFTMTLAPDLIGYLYAAPVGDPSLGPVAYPHRASAMEIPQATLSHHVQDSTHIANNVVTAGVKRGIFGAAASVFHGGEPDEQRWDIDGGSIDSWAVRLTADPTPNLTAQISTGHLKKPEALESGNVQRTTASLAYSVPMAFGMWSSSLIFGTNHKDHGRTYSWTAETLAQLDEHNWLTARGEIVDKDELFAGAADVPPSIAEGTWRIKALTVGYTRDVWSNSLLVGGIGGNVTLYDFPSALKPYYGGNPTSAYLFIRIRNAGGGHQMTGMPGM